MKLLHYGQKAKYNEVLLDGEVIITNLNVSQNDQAYLKF